jgi:hypothetical protein
MIPHAQLGEKDGCGLEITIWVSAHEEELTERLVKGRVSRRWRMREVCEEGRCARRGGVRSVSRCASEIRCECRASL